LLEYIKPAIHLLINFSIVKKGITWLIYAFISLIGVGDVHGQKILYPEYYPPDIRWDNFLIKAGEASQASLCIHMDSKGFLWSGTETALYRYDGTRYVEYGVRTSGNKGFTGFSVNCILEDSEGTIWIGTSEALNKLDQKTGTFSHYFPDPTRSSGISNFIRGIKEDRYGLLWIQTKKHVYSFDRRNEKFTSFITDSLSWYPQNYIFIPEDQCYAEDRTGNKWFVTFRGLYVFDNHYKTFRMVLPEQNNPEIKGIKRIKCVGADKNGTLWIGTDGAGLLRWNDRQNRPEKIDIAPEGVNQGSFNAISSVLVDRNGTIWSFGNSSFSNYNPRDKSMKNYIIIYNRRTLYENPGNEVSFNQVFQHYDGTLWCLNKVAGLMFRFDPETEKLSLYRVPNFVVYQCVMDQTGSFWFACIRNNIFRLVRDKIPYLSIQVNNSSHVAQVHRGAFLEDGQNQVYFLFLTGMHVCRNFDVSSSLIINGFRFPDGDSIAGGGFRDSKGNLWFGNKKGNIAKYDPLTRMLTMLTYEKDPGYTEVVYVPLIREDKTGNIWVATTKGLTRIDPVTGESNRVLDFNNDPMHKDVMFPEDFLIDSQENFWILTSRSIQSIHMPDMKITDHTEFGNGIFSSAMSNIRAEENSKGEVFILNSRYGVYQFDRQHETFVKTSFAREESGTEYFDLLIDRRDRLWIAHNRGITVYDPGNKSARLIKTQRLQFDIQSFQMESGKILILNDNHLYVFEEDIPLNKHIPPVFLTRLLINGTDYNKFFPDDSAVSSLHAINLPYKLNTIGFEFAALNYLNPERNQYRYFMEGYDRDTSLIGQGLTADYKNMPPGRYKFWVTGSNNDGIWNPSGITLDIRIYPPWYRTATAWLSYVAIITLLIWVYIRRREYHLRNEKRRLESEIKAATGELERKNLQLTEIDRIKTHFFTDIAHEIRTPLSLILGPIENISKEGIPDRRMSMLIDLMKRNAQRLMNLVNQLLDISRLDAGKMKITLVEDDIVKCIRMLVYEFLSLADSKLIKYIADLPDKCFKTLFDREKIEKIITNLLSNAFKYTPRKGTVHCIVTIESGEKADSHFLRIRVVDTGSGIGKEHHFRIFERFYRVEGHHETVGYGTGIGLSLVQEFVSLLHGEIKVESTPGKGSDFSVVLPLGKDHLSPEDYVITPCQPPIAENQVFIARHDYPESETVKPVPMTRMRLLIIEDNEDLRTFIKQTLENDYVILESENGRTGLNTAFTMMPDLIVTDIMMPDLDGLELCRVLKNDERTSHIPVIMLTAKATSEDKIAGLKTGADDYIVKPFNMIELSTRISNLLVTRNKLKLKYSKFHLVDYGNKIPESVDDRFMMRVLKTIHSEIADFSFDVGTLNEQIGMSRTHLTRKLKILTGLSPGTLIRNIRLEKAAELLLKKTGNITQIANSVGISNPSNFTKAFRTYFGVSPRNYLKRQIS
jgi:signal transduction histidine kinase/DNA-binding response OmpR family regulator/ligand-binding sensor domain-containing protein